VRQTPWLSMLNEYYWIWAVYQGRLVIVGPKTNETDAYKLGSEKLPCVFNIERLRTRDRAQATRIIKAKYLESSGNLEQAMKRANHPDKGENNG